MKNIFKIVFFSSLLFNSFFVKAQITVQQYLDTEKIRAENVDATEVDINNYIANNVESYNLTKTVIDDVTSSLLNEGIVSQIEISKALLEVKKNELRKQYFVMFPDKIDFYIPTTVPYELRLECINGGFEEETDPIANYSFFSSSRTGVPVAEEINGCNTLQDIVNFTPGINDFGARVSLISSTLNVANYLQFDPTLNTAARGFIHLPTVSPNGGNNSIKLNGSPFGGRDVTTMSRDIFIGPTDTTLDYEFSLLLQDSGVGHALAQKPTFRVDLIVGGVVVNTRCINAEPNCIFAISHANNTGTDQDIYYSGWRCDQIDVTGFRNQNARIVFTITDCSLGGHYGTVYIDNICNFTCSNPVIGALITNPPNNCPDLINNTPYQVCGTFIPPLSSVLDNMTISVSQNGGTFTPINGAQLQVTGNNYCLSFDPNIFGSSPNGNTYQFQITANFTQLCGTLVAPIANTTFASVTFTNCCEPTLILTSPADNLTNNFSVLVKHRERSNWISASNIIGIGNNNFQDGVVYHAGNFVELTPGFDAINDSQFVAYVEGCTTNFEYRNQDVKSNEIHEFEEVKNNLVKVSKDFSIVPNPSNSLIEISTTNLRFNKVEIISIDGRKVFDISVKNTNKMQVDISTYQNGIYIVTVIDSNGQQFSQKFIKN